MRLTGRWAAVILLAACLPPVPHDPRAAGSDLSRWEARTRAAQAAAFDTALAVLADSGFTARHADRSTGIIGTNLRRMDNGDAKGDYRLDLMLLRAGDSTRVVVTGEWCQVSDGALKCYPRSARGYDWFVVRNIGEALLARAR